MKNTKLIRIICIVGIILLLFSACGKPKTFSEKLFDNHKKDHRTLYFPVDFDWEFVYIVYDNNKSSDQFTAENNLTGQLSENQLTEDEYRVIFSDGISILAEYILNKKEIYYETSDREMFYRTTEFSALWKENEDGSRLLYVTVGSI